MSFQELPAQLIVAIGEHCEPHDAYRLALSCRDVRGRLSKILLKHRKVWRLWNTIDTTTSKRPFHEKLVKMTRNPHLALFVETFKCELEYQNSGAFTESEMADMMQNLKKFATTHGHIFDAFKDEAWQANYRSDLENCHMCTLCTYLIYVTPKLRRLECFGNTVDDDLLKLIINVAQAPTIPEGMPLQLLQSMEVELDQNVDEGGLPADWLIACMYLPCLKTFTTDRMGNVVRYLDLKNAPSSNITKIVLTRCTFEPDTLIRILSKTTNLKSFAYENGQISLVYEGGSFSPKKITTALVNYAGHSLEHLTIRGDDDDIGVSNCSSI